MEHFNEEIQYVDRNSDKNKKKTVFCLEIIHRKFKCIILSMLIVILLLEITKIILPSLTPDDQKELSRTLYRSVKKLGKLITQHYNVSLNLSEILTTTTTTQPSAEYVDNIELK